MCWPTENAPRTLNWCDQGSVIADAFIWGEDVLVADLAVRTVQIFRASAVSLPKRVPLAASRLAFNVGVAGCANRAFGAACPLIAVQAVPAVGMGEALQALIGSKEGCVTEKVSRTVLVHMAYTRGIRASFTKVTQALVVRAAGVSNVELVEALIA